MFKKLYRYIKFRREQRLRIKSIELTIKQYAGKQWHIDDLIECAEHIFNYFFGRHVSEQDKSQERKI
jgi:hypothetical protein